jgi:hypothetical protein
MSLGRQGKQDVDGGQPGADQRDGVLRCDLTKRTVLPRIGDIAVGLDQVATRGGPDRNAGPQRQHHGVDGNEIAPPGSKARARPVELEIDDLVRPDLDDSPDRTSADTFVQSVL